MLKFIIFIIIIILENVDGMFVYQSQFFYFIFYNITILVQSLR